MSNYLDARNETYGLDLKIADSMTNRAEILTADGGTDVSVQELINALCDVLDGEDVYDIDRMTGLGEDRAKRVDEIRNKIKSLWTYPNGTKVL